MEDLGKSFSWISGSVRIDKEAAGEVLLDLPVIPLGSRISCVAFLCEILDISIYGVEILWIGQKFQLDELFHFTIQMIIAGFQSFKENNPLYFELNWITGDLPEKYQLPWSNLIWIVFQTEKWTMYEFDPLVISIKHTSGLCHTAGEEVMGVKIYQGSARTEVRSSLVAAACLELLFFWKCTSYFWNCQQTSYEHMSFISQGICCTKKGTKTEKKGRHFWCAGAIEQVVYYHRTLINL